LVVLVSTAIAVAKERFFLHYVGLAKVVAPSVCVEVVWVIFFVIYEQ
jgi:hypothetical protein